jgi:hypothetical protein
MDDEVSGASVDIWFRACSELLQIRLATMSPTERARFLLGVNARILEFSAYEIAPVQDPGRVAHLIRMAAEIDRMIDGRNVVTLPRATNI